MANTVSLEVAKKLKEAGWKKGAHFWWQATYSRSPEMAGMPCVQRCGDSECHHPVAWHLAHYEDLDMHYDIAAPTIAELLEALPKTVDSKKTFEGEPWPWAVGSLSMNWSEGGWEFGYECGPEGDWLDGTEEKGWKDYVGEANNPADALGLLWLALKAKNLV